MLRSWLCFCFALNIALAAAPLTSSCDPKLPRRIAVGKSVELTLNADTHIVVPPNSKPTVRFAAKELAQYLGEALEGAIPVVTAPQEQGVAICLGDNQYAREMGIDVNTFDRDGFAIKSQGNRIVIAGRDGNNDPERFDTNYFEHATLFGAYDFLERFAGVRFYFPGKLGVVVPLQKQITIGQIDIYDRPDHFQRRSAEFYNPWFDQENAKGGAVLQDYRRRSQTFYVPCCHSLEQSGYYRRFAKEHPEYFAVDAGGKIYSPDHWSVGSGCYLSPGYRNEIYLDAISYLKGEGPEVRGVLGGTDRNPKDGFRWSTVLGQPGFYSVMPGDHHRRCLCPKCKEFMAEHGESEYVWDMVADIAERVKNAGFSDRITGMAYARYTVVPKRDLPDNLEVMVATTGPWVENIPLLRNKGDNLIRDWTKKLGHKVWLWTYPGKLSGNSTLANYGIPQMAPHAVGNFFKRQAPYTFGAFYEAESEWWLFNYLNTYLFFRIAWDNATDVDDLIVEHHQRMFGDAAAEITEFYETLEKFWIERMCGKVEETPLGPFVVPPSNFEKWEKIYNPGQLKDFAALFNRAEQKVTGLTLERVKFIREKFLGELEKASTKYFREKELISNWNFFIKPLEENETVVIDGTLNEAAWKAGDSVWLLPTNSDVCEVRTQVYARHDNDNLYFAFACEEPRMADVIARQKEHDHKDIWSDSDIELMLYPEASGKYYQLMINTLGTVGDVEHTVTGGTTRQNVNWNADCRVAAQSGENGFTIEVLIPKKSIPEFDPAKMRANFCRHRSLTGTKVKTRYYSWSPNRAGFHAFSSYGELFFAPREDGNLIRNGDFTEPYSGTWHPSSYGPDGPSFDERCFFTGGRSAKFVSNGQRVSLFQSLPLKANTTYAVSFFLKMEDVKPVKPGGGFYLLLGDNSNNYFPKDSKYTGTMQWTRQGTMWTTGADGGKSIPGKSRCIIPTLRDATGTVWIDDLRFEEVGK
jgi:hypothetical protein